MALWPPALWGAALELMSLWESRHKKKTKTGRRRWTDGNAEPVIIITDLPRYLDLLLNMTMELSFNQSYGSFVKKELW